MTQYPGKQIKTKILQLSCKKRYGRRLMVSVEVKVVEP